MTDIEPQKGWMCPACLVIYAPYIACCECRQKYKILKPLTDMEKELLKQNENLLQEKENASF